MNLGTAQIIQGNALALPLPDASVDLICTSPPYFGLRSYQDAGVHYQGQLGSEATPAEFIDALLAATREMVRVLKPSGSIFVNLGDKYAGSRMDGSSGWSTATLDGGRGRLPELAASQGVLNTRSSIPTKSLMGLPWRYAIACIDQLGLILRAEIIWAKPNGLPESVTDRVRRSHETWFHFVRNPRYFAAVDEIREQPLGTGGGRGHYQASASAAMNGTGMPKHVSLASTEGNPLGKLPGSVWTIPTQPLTVPPELGVDHFAAYPMEWPRRIIQGWTPNGVCTACGQGRRPITVTDLGVKERETPAYIGDAKQSRHGMGSTTLGSRGPSATITGYTCPCLENPLPLPLATRTGIPPTTAAVILDPFGGTGTTALVAKALGRTGISIDLSSDYCRLAEWRCNDPRELAAALQVEKPEPVHPDQLDLFSEAPMNP